MTDITEFLRARLDEQEDAWRGGLNLQTRPDFSRLSELMLAQVAAMRAIVDKLTSRERQDDSEEGLWHKVGYDRAAFDVLRHLAAIWSSHPHYDPAWAPEGE